MEKVKDEKIGEILPEIEKEKFGESGINLLNLIAEILAENALKAFSVKDSEN